MGDFERTFGAGADVGGIIDSFNTYDALAEALGPRYSYSIDENGNFLKELVWEKKKKKFSSFEEASEWSKNHNGKMFKRCPDGDGFIEG